MILNTKQPFERNKAQVRFEYLINKGAVIELTEKLPKRSTDQNKYLHAVITIYACEVGETIEYVKQRVFKAEVNPETFIFDRENKKTGVFRKALRSSADLDTKEMVTCIDRFLIHAAKQGIYIMTADEFKQNYFLVEQMKEANKEYL